MIDVPAARVKDTKAVCPCQRQGAAHMGRPACCHIIGGPSPGKPNTTFPLPEGPKLSNLPGSNP